MNSTVDDYNNNNNKNKIQLILNPELKLINRENCINNHNQRYKSEFEFSVKNKNEDEQQQQQQEKQIKLIENQTKINNLRKDNFELNYTMSSSLNSNSNSNQNNTTQENYYYSIINAKTPTDLIDLNNQTTDRSRSNLLSFETNLKNHKSEIINTITTPNSDIEIIDNNNNNNNNNILSNIKHNIEIIKNDNNNNKNNNNNDTFIFTRDQYELKNTLKSNINNNINNNNNNIENDNKEQVHDLDNHKFQINENNQFKKDIDYYSIAKNNNNNNIFNYKNEKDNNNKSTLLIKTQTINEALGKHFTQDLKDLKETIDRIDSEIDSSFKSRILFSSPLSMDYNTNTTSRFTHQNTNTGAMFHPTWDEWKRTHMNENNNKTTINDSFKNNKQQSFTNMNKHNESETRDYKKNLLDNTNNHNLTTTKKSIIEETYTTKKSSQKQHQQFESQNEQQQLQQNQMKQKYKLSEQQDVFNPPSQILINNSSNSSQQSHHRLTSNRSPHYPVYPYDFQEQRPPSPVHLSSIVLAKEPPLEVKTQDERRKFPEPEPEPPQPVPAPEPKIKTILSTQKRKESAPNLTGWRTESDSDTEIQNRLLAKASGSIPIEYISIRRDPKPSEKKMEKNKKSITTGTNTCVERGKRIASTNTNQDEIPQYNLHVSLDSLFVKSRQEASTSTDRRNQNASTETEVRLKDACTEPEPEPKQPTPPPPPKPEPQPEPQPEQYIYRQRKSRYTEWETASNPPAETSYRLEFLAKSPRTVHRREFKTYHHHHENSGGFIDLPPIQQTRKIIYEQVRADDDDRLIFGSILNNSSHLRCVNQQYNLRSGSFPCLMPNLIDNSGTTRRYVKQTHTTNYSPFIRQEYEINMLPMAIKQSNGYMNTNVDVWNQQFNQMSQKFNEIFGQQKVQQTFIQPAETGRTQRYYKYSRTTSDNNQHMPSFGEIFNQQQQQYHQQYQHRIGASYNSSASTGTTAYQQDSSYQRAPIVEIPVTPNSTMGKSSRFFSSSSSYRGRANSSSGINTGPIITSLSPNTSSSNLYVSENKSTGTTGANWFSSSASSSVQKNSFEPVIRKSNYQSMSSSSASRTVRGREEEDEELVNMTNCSIDNDRQFRPIVNENNVKESFKSTSTRSTPIVVMNSNSKNSSAKKSQNYSCSSYEYSAQKI